MKTQSLILILIVVLLVMNYVNKNNSYKENFVSCTEQGMCNQVNKKPIVVKETVRAINDPGIVIDGYQRSDKKPLKSENNVDGDEDSDDQAVLEMDVLDDGMLGEGGLLYAPCSVSCCSAQDNVPGELQTHEMNGNSYVKSPYMCSNSWYNSGCVCMTSKQKKFLGSRGGNVNMGSTESSSNTGIGEDYNE